MNRFLLLSVVALPMLVDASLKSAALLLLAGLCALAMRRASAAARHVVWLAAVLALLLVPVLSVVLPGWRVLPQWAVVKGTEGTQRTKGTQAPPETLPLPVAAPNATAMPTSLPAVQPEIAAPLPSLKSLPSLPSFPSLESLPPPAPNPTSWLVLAWAVGCILLILRLTAAHFLIRRATSRSEPPPAELSAAFAAAAKESGLKQPVRLLLDHRRTIPIVWGIFRPCLLLPAECVAWDAAKLRSVLLHEIAHLRRRDPLVQCLMQLACALHWFNPLVWLAAWRLHVERERACDDLVLAKGIKASAYADHLLQIASQLSAARWTTGCGLAMARKSSLEGRLLAVLSERLDRTSTTRKLAAAAMLLAAAITVPIAMLRASEPEKPKPDAAAVNPEPKDAKSQALLAHWKKSARADGKIPGGCIGQIAASLKTFMDLNPGSEAAAKCEAVFKKCDATHDWTLADTVALLDEIETAAPSHAEWTMRTNIERQIHPGKPLPADLKDAPWGPPAPNGLRMAWLCGTGVPPVSPDPAANPQGLLADGRDAHATFGAILTSRVLFHNTGKAPVCFATEDWIQSGMHSAKDANGKDIPISATERLGLRTRMIFRLAPGEYAEIEGHGIGIGSHENTAGKAGAWIKAKEGDIITFTPGEIHLSFQTWQNNEGRKDSLTVWLETVAARLAQEGPHPASWEDRAALYKRVSEDLGIDMVETLGKHTYESDPFPDSFKRLTKRFLEAAQPMHFEGELTSGETKITVTAAKDPSDPSDQTDLPKHQDAPPSQTEPKDAHSKTLLDQWKKSARSDGKIPGGCIGQMTASLKSFMDLNAGTEYATKCEAVFKKCDPTHDWTLADTVALLDEIELAAPSRAEWLTRLGESPILSGKPLPAEFKDAPWGETQNSLRAAWVLEPAAAEQRIGAALKARLLVQNPGKVPVVVHVPTWYQGNVTGIDENGAKVEASGSEWTTIAQLVPVRLGPGEFIEIRAPGIGFGPRAGMGPWAGPRVGSNVLAKPGDLVTLTHSLVPLDGSEVGVNETNPHVSGPGWWVAHIKSRLARELPLPADVAERTRLLDRTMHELFATAPTPEETAAFVADQTPTALDSLVKRLADRTDIVSFSGKLPTAPVKFRVLAADANAAKQPRVVLGAGEYPLSEGTAQSGAATLKIVSSKTNDAKILIEPTEATGKLPPDPHKFEIPDGWGTWAIVCQPNEGFFYLLHKGGVRKIDYSNPGKVTDTPADDLPAEFRDEVKRQFDIHEVSEEQQAELFGKPATSAAPLNPSQSGGGKPLPAELNAAPWGKPAENGLRAAWLLEPAPSVAWASIAEFSYPLGTVLKARVLFHNTGKAPLVIRTSTWRRNDEHNARDEKGQKIAVNARSFRLGTAADATFRLAPGEYCEVSGGRIAIGTGDATIGAIIEAKEGDMVTLSHTLDGAREKPNELPDPGELQKRFYDERKEPLPVGIGARAVILRNLTLEITGELPTQEERNAFEADKDPHAIGKLIARLQTKAEGMIWRGKLTTGETKFRVVSAQPDAAKAPSTANSQGSYVPGTAVKPDSRQLFNEDYAAFAVQSEKDVNFVLFYQGGLSRGITEWSSGSKWRFEGNVYLVDRAKTAIAGKNVNKRVIPVKYTSDDTGTLSLDGRDYDLKSGRVFILRDEGAPEQLDKTMPPRSMADLEKLGEVLKPKVEAPKSKPAAAASGPTDFQARALFARWLADSRRQGDIAGGYVAHLTQTIRHYLKQHPRATAAQFDAMLPKLDASHDWPQAAAIALLDEIAAISPDPISWAKTDLAVKGVRLIKPGKPLPAELEKADWGPASPQGLRAAWLLEPRAAEVALGTVLTSRVLIRNTSQQEIIVSTQAWTNPYDSPMAWNAAGKQIAEHAASDFGITPLITYRLAPGAYGEAISYGVATGDPAEFKAQFSHQSYLTSLHAVAGDQVRISAQVNASGSNEEHETKPEAIRQFIRERLQLLAPLPQAKDEREAIVRSLTTEILGKMPIPAETSEFISDTAPEAVEKLVQSLATHYTQHQGKQSTFDEKLKTGETKFLVTPLKTTAAAAPPASTSAPAPAAPSALTYAKPGFHSEKFQEEDAKRPGAALMGPVKEPQPGADAEGPLVLGLRTASDAQWHIGGTAKIGLVVRNRTDHDVKFSYSDMLDSGLTIVAIDEAGKEHQADVGRTPLGFVKRQQMLLPPGHVATVREFTLLFDSAKRDVYDSQLAAFHLPPGTYKLRCTWSDASPTDVKEDEWSGQLVSVEHPFTLAEATVPKAAATAAAPGTYELGDGVKLVIRKMTDEEHLKNKKAGQPATFMGTIVFPGPKPEAARGPSPYEIGLQEIFAFAWEPSSKKLWVTDISEGSRRIIWMDMGDKDQTRPGPQKIVLREFDFTDPFQVKLTHITTSENGGTWSWGKILPQPFQAPVLQALGERGKRLRDFVATETGKTVDQKVGKKSTQAVTKVETDEKFISLTFNTMLKDETAALLDLLKAHQATATFFVVGKSVAGHEALLQRMLAEGHEVGNLSMTHPHNLSRTSDADFLVEVNACHDAITKAIGKAPLLFRPPGGSVSPAQIALLREKKNCRTVLWTVDPEDWKDRKVDLITQRVLGGAEKGKIILLHSYFPNTVAALPAILQGLKLQGLQTVTISKLLAAAPTTPKEKGGVSSTKAKWPPVRPSTEWSPEFLTHCKTIAEARGTPDAKPEALIAWGEEEHGIHTGLLIAPKVTLGSQLPTRMVLRNVSNEAKDLRLSLSLNRLQASVRTPDGKTLDVHKVQLRGLDALSLVTLKPQEQIEFDGPPVQFGVEVDAETKKPKVPEWPICGVETGPGKVMVHFKVEAKTGEAEVEVMPAQDKPKTAATDNPTDKISPISQIRPINPTPTKLQPATEQKLDWSEPSNGLRMALTWPPSLNEPAAGEIADLFVVVQNVSNAPVRFCTTDAAPQERWLAPYDEAGIIMRMNSREPSNVDVTLQPHDAIFLRLLPEGAKDADKSTTGALMSSDVRQSPKLKLRAGLKIATAPTGAWTGTLTTPDTRAGLNVDLPANRKAQELLKIWIHQARQSGKIPGGFIARLAEHVKVFVKANAAEASGAPVAKRMELLLSRLDSSRDWQPADATALLNDVAAVSDSVLSVALEEIAAGKVQHGLPWVKELDKAPWGDPLPNGLRSATIVGPGVASRLYYVDWIGNVVSQDRSASETTIAKDAKEIPLGTPLGCRIVIHNAGKDPVVFRTRTWHHIEPTAKDSKGKEIGIESHTLFTRPPLVTFRLDPDRYIELPSPAFGLGKYGFHDFKQNDIHTWIGANVGDEMTLTPGPLPLGDWNDPAADSNPRWWLDTIRARLNVMTPLPTDAADRRHLLEYAMRDLFLQNVSPTEEETKAFLTDTSADALTKLAERISQRPGLIAWTGSLQSGSTKFRVTAEKNKPAPNNAPAATAPPADSK